MRPEEKCVSLETAKKLKEAGFPQVTERCWWADVESCIDGSKPRIIEGSLWTLHYGKPVWHEATSWWFAAPDAQEIGVELGDYVGAELNASSRRRNKWHCYYKAKKMRDDDFPWPIKGYENEAEARAAAFLYLKQQNLI